jgi:hypothetical protein
LLVNIAELDGKQVRIRFGKDPGQAGKSQALHLVRALSGFSDGVPLAALAKRQGVSPSYFTRLVRLSYLAPDITEAIIDGRQPPDLTGDKLTSRSRRHLPSDTTSGSVGEEPARRQRRRKRLTCRTLLVQRRRGVTHRFLRKLLPKCATRQDFLP